jgi:hypothetical protein
MGYLGLISRLQIGVLLADGRDRLGALELVWEWLDPGVAQRGQLLAARCEDV